MFTIDIKINDTEIIKIYGHNEGFEYEGVEKPSHHPLIEAIKFRKSAKAKCKYYYEIYQKGSGEARPGKFITGIVKHKREEGMIKLIGIICREYEKRRRKNNG